MKHEALLICILATLLVGRVEGSAQPQNPKNKEYELVVYVSNIDGEAISGIVIATKGKGPQCKPTDGSGKTMLKLQGEVVAGGEIDLVLVVDVKENEGWEIIPNYRPLIHAFNNNPNARTTLILRRKPLYKEKEMLTSPPIITDGGRHNTFRSTVGTSTNTLESELIDAYIRIGHSEYNQKHYDEAFNAYKKALELRPDYDEVLHYAALSLLQQKKHLEVLPYIEKCLEIRKRKPESVDLAATYETYSVVLSALNREAEAEAQKALAAAVRSRLPK